MAKQQVHVVLVCALATTNLSADVLVAQYTGACGFSLPGRGAMVFAERRFWRDFRGNVSRWGAFMWGFSCLRTPKCALYAQARKEAVLASCSMPPETFCLSSRNDNKAFLSGMWLLKAGLQYLRKGCRLSLERDQNINGPDSQNPSNQQLDVT